MTRRRLRTALPPDRISPAGAPWRGIVRAAALRRYELHLNSAVPEKGVTSWLT